MEGAIAPLIIRHHAGLSQAISPDMATIETSRQGTVVYAPWEMAMQGKTSPKADVYALALIIGEALTGQIFCEGMTVAQALVAVIHQGLRPKLPLWVPRELQSLLRRAWSGNRALRPTIEDFGNRLQKIQLKLVGDPDCRAVGCLGTPWRAGTNTATQDRLVSAV